MDGVFSDDLADPCPDIHELFRYYNVLYFSGSLDRVSVEWSSKRMTMCAGVCVCEGRNAACRIRLSQPLLQFRPARDLKDTLLHEMIHAFLFLSGGPRDHDDHGPRFQEHMHRINRSSAGDIYRPTGGYRITIYHTFHDEVDHFRVHAWKCGRCGHEVKRAMNRPPSGRDCPLYRKATGIPPASRCHRRDCAWHRHEASCGGTFVKTQGPQRNEKRRRTKAESSTSITAYFPGQGHRLGGRDGDSRCGSTAQEDARSASDGVQRSSRVDHSADIEIISIDDDSENDPPRDTPSKSEQRITAHVCPVCGLPAPDDNAALNAHIDSCLQRGE